MPLKPGMSYHNLFKIRWTKFARIVKEDRGHVCERCGQRFEREDLHLHHIFKRRIFPEFLFELFNIVVCCQTCHLKLEKFEPIFCKLY